MTSTAPAESSPRLTGIQWLICIIAVIGFAFDSYVLLMLPLILRPALEQLGGLTFGSPEYVHWRDLMFYVPAVFGGVFGLLGGYLTDRLGRRRILTWSILVYAFSALGAGFATSLPMLLILRCTTFIGVCVEFVAAVAWLAELFPNPQQREKVLGFTQAFSSFGGLMVAGAYYLAVTYGQHWPAIHGGHAPWRYTLISGLVPAIPLMFLLPLLPESPAWKERRAAGTLKRPSIAQLFQPAFRRTTIATAVLFACAYGAAFGAIQMTPQIVPGLVPGLPELVKLRKQVEVAQQKGEDAKEMKKRIAELTKVQGQIISNVQTHQEIGGLVGRFALAWLAIVVAGRKA